MRRFVCLLLLIAPCLLAPADEPKPAAGVRLTRDGGFKQHLSWSPDGKKFLCTRIHEGKMGLWTMDAGGGDGKTLVAATEPRFEAHWSPDGKRVSFVWESHQRTDGSPQRDTGNADR